MPYKRIAGTRGLTSHIADLKMLKKRGALPCPIPFPDLSTAKPGLAPLSNTLAVKFSSQRDSAAHHPDAQQFPVGNSHKQGNTIITPGMIANGELQYMGGKKT